ncbi:unnamed protein product [Tilletia controversa]|uniref:Uncharacterized protein n=1 Tax=Tilletia controversa TaxID=13291 RepID=A0A8X7MIP2_9BASI|nr:hypothetical protein A4X06_0g9403 [Tilletia controversa]CAD6949046.1 unnamed protein product [Tilletia controversa]
MRRHAANATSTGCFALIYAARTLCLDAADTMLPEDFTWTWLIVGEIDPLTFSTAWPSLSPYVNKGSCHAVDGKQTVVRVNWLGMDQKRTPEQQEL